MELTQEHLEVAAGAYFASLDGNGVVVAPHAFPAAHDLAEQGWLERRFEDNGDMSWWWTSTAHAAIGLGEVLGSGQGREN